MQKPAAGPRWRREPLQPTGVTRGRARRLLVVAAGSVLAIALGLLLWVLSWLSPLKPAALVLIGAGYEENLAFPANVYGWDGLGGLAAVTTEQPTAPFGVLPFPHLRSGLTETTQHAGGLAKQTADQRGDHDRGWEDKANHASGEGASRSCRGRAAPYGTK